MTGVRISAVAVSFEYDTADGPLPVLHHLDLSIGAGEHVAVTGSSGAGKSTLLALIGGLERLQTGSLTVGETDLATLKGDDLARYRHRTVGFVFQHFGLLGNLTALENVEMAMMFAAAGRRDRRSRANELLGAVGVDHRADHRPAHLSGGEAQRVALARALANNPSLILADEPTGNLDGETSQLILDLLERTSVEHGCTLVVVTHDPAVAARADRRVHLAAGTFRHATLNS